MGCPASEFRADLLGSLFNMADPKGETVGKGADPPLGF